MLGDTEDFRKRLRKLIPFSWFPNPAPVLWGLLSGAAYVAASSYALLKFAKAQTRMATTSDAFLDIAAMDYCGSRIQRRTGETDQSFRDRIVEEVLRIRNTRLGIEESLMELTGRSAQVFEPWNTVDSGALDYTIFLGGHGPFQGIGFCGSTSLPFNVFVNAYRPLPGSGFAATDAEIYSMVNNVRAAGVKAWVSIQN